MRKFVELDGEYGGLLEIDKIKLKRVAVEFKAWLLKIDPSSDRHNFLRRDLPLVDAALSGKLPMPYKHFPHNWELREGLLPKDYLAAAAPFYNTIEGALLEPPEVIEKDGKYYAWCEFEDPPAEGD